VVQWWFEGLVSPASDLRPEVVRVVYRWSTGGLQVVQRGSGGVLEGVWRGSGGGLEGVCRGSTNGMQGVWRGSRGGLERVKWLSEDASPWGEPRERVAAGGGINIPTHNWG
jgi:hypothetical protein